jgi:hypothetical protein
MKPPIRKAASSTSTTYAAALESMRATVSQNVTLAIDASKPARLPRAPRGKAGQANIHFFDGVVEALAIAVCDAARPGYEMQMADLVAKALLRKVHFAVEGPFVGQC